MMLHLDLEVDDPDQTVAHAVSVGAELAGFQAQLDVRVMLDPAGHPFCRYFDRSAEAATTPTTLGSSPADVQT